MIDTIKLKFNYPLPNNEFFCEKIRGKEIWTNNTWRKSQQKLGIYVPKYWIESDFKYPDKTYFCIELSAPKLIQGSNIIEIKENQLDELANAITEFCKQIGIFIFPNQIRNCQPSLIAICKNINLTSVCSVNNALRVLSCFDYKTHANQRVIEFSDYKHGGKELNYGISTETLKVYDKAKEVLNNASSKEELVIADFISRGEYWANGHLAREIIRFELTLKNSRKVKDIFKNFLGVLPPTLENIFQQSILDQILIKNINDVFNHPLQKIIFLSLERQPVIDGFLEKHYRHIQTKATIRQMISELQERGLAETRQKYLKSYKSRQTWYNYLRRLAVLQSNFDWQALGKLDNVRIHKFILEQFGISSTIQQELAFNFTPPMSKIIDANQRNTRGYYG